MSLSQSPSRELRTADCMHMSFTVLVPNSNEDSVDIYDGLDVNPSSSSSTGKSSATILL